MQYDNLCDFLSKRAEVKHKGFGKIVKLVFEAEEKGNSDLAHENFENARERAELVTFNDEHVTDVAEYAILHHRQSKHSEDHVDRMAELKPLLTDEELELSERDFWNS